MRCCNLRLVLSQFWSLLLLIHNGQRLVPGTVGFAITAMSGLCSRCWCHVMYSFAQSYHSRKYSRIDMMESPNLSSFSTEVQNHITVRSTMREAHQSLIYLTLR
ncbi:hypothetical protein DFS34DRAFT_609330 [Phlyctochytrium arcticum]|nr:hypothetical protein DFS34DRAFT_609330 [Phlyctochytrium arcticum]